MTLRGVLFAIDADDLASPHGRRTVAQCFARYRLGVIGTGGATGPDMQAAYAAHDLHRYFEAWATTADIGDDRRRVVRAALGAMGVQPGQAAIVTADVGTFAAANAVGCHGLIVGAALPEVTRTDAATVAVMSLGDVASGLDRLARGRRTGRGYPAKPASGRADAT